MGPSQDSEWGLGPSGGPVREARTLLSVASGLESREAALSLCPGLRSEPTWHRGPRPWLGPGRWGPKEEETCLGSHDGQSRWQSWTQCPPICTSGLQAGYQLWSVPSLTAQMLSPGGGHGGRPHWEVRACLRSHRAPGFCIRVPGCFPRPRILSTRKTQCQRAAPGMSRAGLPSPQCCFCSPPSPVSAQLLLGLVPPPCLKEARSRSGLADHAALLAVADVTSAVPPPPQALPGQVSPSFRKVNGPILWFYDDRGGRDQLGARTSLCGLGGCEALRKQPWVLCAGMRLTSMRHGGPGGLRPRRRSGAGH
uniref:uncharacterized protein LOC120889944 n=1 Tax=Ictidomys tridecemlineatus TaxID=43179 RepID=UPI001A9FF628|nr:uncharacterized protein LOC120889944 [Ictidomys tridecemlineatus]